MRVKKKFSCKRDQIRLTRVENLLRMPRFGDQSHGNRFDARLLSHTLCVGNVITGHTRHDFGIDRSTYSPGRTSYDINTAT